MKLTRLICGSATGAALLSLLAEVALADDVSITITTVPIGLALTIDGSPYTAPAVFTWASGSAHTLIAPSPQLSSDNHTRYSFASWSDGGAQTNELVIPATDTTYTANFNTEYLLDTAVTPAGTGTITNSPPGLWYSPNQLVSLTALTNTGFRFFSWAGADTCTSNTAQVTMTGYRSVTATFVPADFPFYTVTNYGGATPGVFIGALPGRIFLDKTTTYYVVLDNSGSNILFSSKTNTLSRFVAPNGLIAQAAAAISGWRFKDETFSPVDSFSVQGYTLDSHDVKLFPNGHALVFGQEIRPTDMSQIVPGGRADAMVTGDVIQELDANKQVVFEWHTLDHIPITNSFFDLTQKNIDYAHVNAMTIDPTDNNLLLSLRTTSEIVKVDRRTGQVIWRLGGKANMFTFINEHPENAPYYTVGQHDIHRLANGNLLYFDNGNISGGGVTPSDRTWSRAVEYQLDEVAMTATLVWEYRHTPDISAPCTGSVRRFANGNTLVNWGCAIGPSGVVITEVSPAGNVVFEVNQPPGNGSADGLTKQVWNSPDLVRSTAFTNVVSGQTYDSADAGVSITLNSLTGASDNQLLVQKHLDAVRFPQFMRTAPQVIVAHATLSSSSIDSLEAQLQFALPDTSFVFDTPMIHDPTRLVVYQRPVPGQGTFTPLPTTYNSASQTLNVTTTQTGEFIFGYPDLTPVPLVPVIVAPSDQGTVNQAQPINLDWSPQGLVGSYHLQVATDPDFNSLLLDTNGLTSSAYLLTNAAPNTQYYWRVNLSNDAGTSDWAATSFTTVPALLGLTSPNGGEVWQRGLKYYVRWNDNLAENIILDLYTNGVFMRSIATNASIGAYQWQILFNIPPRSDYSMRIRSATNSAMADFSDATFSILDAPKFAPGSVTPMPDGTVQLSLTVTGAPQATVLGSTNLLDWELLQTVPLSNGSATWTDTSAVNYSNRFYRLRVP